MAKIDKVKILGIDPGTQVMGYAVLDYYFGHFNVEALGVFKLKKFETHQEKLKEIFLQTQDLIEMYLPAEMAIEAPFYGKNVQSMLKLGRAQGVTIAAGITMGLNITEYAPKKIKVSVTGNGNATKEQVAAMLTNQFKIDLSKQYLDATDALATAACHFYQNKHLATGQKRYDSWDSYLKDNPKRRKK